MYLETTLRMFYLLLPLDKMSVKRVHTRGLYAKPNICNKMTLSQHLIAENMAILF